MQLKRNKLEANKTWIFTDNYVLCMGSNIHADSTATIMTSIDQRFSKGKVWSDDNKRIFHDNTGYIILQADTCITLTENKEGQWKDFMGMYKRSEERRVGKVCRSRWSPYHSKKMLIKYHHFAMM